MKICSIYSDVSDKIKSVIFAKKIAEAEAEAAAARKKTIIIVCVCAAIAVVEAAAAVGIYFLMKNEAVKAKIAAAKEKVGEKVGAAKAKAGECVKCAFKPLLSDPQVMGKDLFEEPAVLEELLGYVKEMRKGNGSVRAFLESKF